MMPEPSVKNLEDFKATLLQMCDVYHEKLERAMEQSDGASILRYEGALMVLNHQAILVLGYIPNKDV